MTQFEGRDKAQIDLEDAENQFYDLLEGMSDEHIERLGAAFETLKESVCFEFGHYVIPDHCGKPEHDYCRWCMDRVPGGAKR